MRWLAIALALGACQSPRREHVRYPLHPRVRSASGGPIELVGGVAHPGTIPYAPGITLRCALRLAGGTIVGASETAELQRLDGRHYTLPVRAIIDGTEPDLELAPGDVIDVRRRRIIID